MFDIVYTYVNGDDPSHLQSKQQAMHVYSPEPESSHVCRFHSSCEIVFSLFSIFLFVSHDELHKIYIVISDNSEQTISFQHPEWIAANTDFQEFITQRIEYVRHSQIIPIEFLPTFNSHVIELYLSNIPNLLDMFVYFNDDCFLGAPTPETFFFSVDEEKKIAKANIYPSTVAMKVVTHSKFAMQNKVTMFQSIMNKTFDLLQSRFVSLRTSQSKWDKCHHQAKPLLRLACQATLKDAVFANAIQQLSARKFRTRNDFAPIELMIGYMYFTGKGATFDAKPFTFYIEWTQEMAGMQKKFEHLLNREQRPTLICINDIPFTTEEQGRPQVQRQRTKTAQRVVAATQSDLSWKVQALSWFAYHYFQKATAQ